MSFRSVVDTVLLLVILGLVVERRWGRGSGNGNENGDGGGKFEFAGDLTGFAPRCEFLSLSLSSSFPLFSIFYFFPFLPGVTL